MKWTDTRNQISLIAINVEQTIIKISWIILLIVWGNKQRTDCRSNESSPNASYGLFANVSI